MLKDEIKNSPAASYWLKSALKVALERDPVDAIRDAETLLKAVKEHFGESSRHTPHFGDS